MIVAPPTLPVTFNAPLAVAFNLPDECETVQSVFICGGSGGDWGPFGTNSGGRGACLTLTGLKLRDFVAVTSYIVVGQGGSNAYCSSGGKVGSAGGGLSGMFRFAKNDSNFISPLVVAAGGGGAARVSMSCDADSVDTNTNSFAITGSLKSASESSCAPVNVNPNATSTAYEYYGLGGRESYPSARRGIDGSGFPTWVGGHLTSLNGLCDSIGGFGGGGSGGGNETISGCGGGGAGYPGGGMCPTAPGGGPAGRSYVDRISFQAVVVAPNVTLTFNGAMLNSSSGKAVQVRGADGTLTIVCSGQNLPPQAITKTTSSTTRATHAMQQYTTTSRLVEQTTSRSTTPAASPAPMSSVDADANPNPVLTAIDSDSNIVTDDSLLTPLIVVSCLLCIAIAVATIAIVYAYAFRLRYTASLANDQRQPQQPVVSSSRTSERNSVNDSSSPSSNRDYGRISPAPSSATAGYAEMQLVKTKAKTAQTDYTEFPTGL